MCCEYSPPTLVTSIKRHTSITNSCASGSLISSRTFAGMSMSQISFFTTWASAENNRWKRSQRQLGSSLTTLIRRRAHSWTHLAGVYLVDDDSERPHVHRARKVRLGVADEHLGCLVRVRSAVGVEGALIKGFVRVLVRVW